MKWLINFTVFALILNVFAVGLGIVNLFLDPNLKTVLVLAVNIFFSVLMYNQYKRLTAVPVSNPGDRNVS